MTGSRDICLKTTEMHVGGSPLRIIESGYPGVKGTTILERKKYALENLDNFRKFLTSGPRGQLDISGVVFVSPDTDEADMAVLFFDNAGYSHMCGKGLLAVGRYAIDKGFLKQITFPQSQVNVQCPSGLVPVIVDIKDGAAARVRFHSVPAFAFAIDLEVDVKDYGRVHVDIGYEGVFFAVVRAEKLGLDVGNARAQDLVAAGTAVSDAVKSAVILHYPDSSDLALLYGTILTDDINGHSRDLSCTSCACVFADGGLDRSLCGSGIAATVAIQYAKKLLAFDQTLVFGHESTGSAGFSGTVIEEVRVGGVDRVTVEVAGRPHYTGKSTVIVEENDELQRRFFPE